MAQPNPWAKHRDIAEMIGEAFANSLTASTGNRVPLGVIDSFDPEDMVGTRPMPLRAIMVTFERPFRDVMVLISSLKDDAISPLAEAGARAVLAAFDIEQGSDEHGAIGAFTVHDGVEYEEIEEALEQTDGLYLEATYDMSLPASELRLVLGTGLLESVNCYVNRISDPLATGAPVARAPAFPDDGSLVLGDDLGLSDADIARIETERILAAAASAGGSGLGIDSYDAMLAAQDAAESEAAAALGVTNAASEAAIANAAALEATAAATRHWTSLLSGVEVELSAELGRADLALGDITSLVAESVLTLDQLVHDPVTVLVNGMPYATARLVVVDGEYGIEIIEVSEQNQLVTSLAA